MICNPLFLLNGSSPEHKRTLLNTDQYRWKRAFPQLHFHPVGDIFYDYTYQRLAHKRYSDIMGNSVTYQYGTAGTGRGRPVRVDDGTGVRLLAYDALGNVTG